MPGRKKIIETPEQFYAYWEEYKEWAVANPVKRSEYRGNPPVECIIPVPRPITITGFGGYLSERDIISSVDDYFYRSGGAYNVFDEVVARIRRETAACVLDGGMTGIYDARIAGAYIGLNSTKIEMIAPGNAAKIDYNQLSDAALLEIVAMADKAAGKKTISE